MMAAGIFAGIVFLGLGLLIGSASHQVSFATVSQIDVKGAIVGGGTDYLALTGDPHIYVINEGDFQPSLSSSAFKNALVSLTYETDSASEINVTAADGYRLDGEGFTVVQLVLVSESGTASTYSSPDYLQHPSGYFDNTWKGAAPFLALGALFFGLSPFAPVRVFTIIQWMFGGAFALTILGLVLAGVSVPDKLVPAAYISAIVDDIALVLVCAVIGGGIGLLIGLVQAVRGGGFAGQGIEDAFAALGEIQNEIDG